jgi:hypothetical protein
MRTPLPIPPVAVAALALLALAGCQPAGGQRPVPSVPQIGADLKCSQGDHGYEDPQAGWGFCYPGTWRYTERAQSSLSPVGLDLTFDITYAPPSAAPCGGSRPPGSSPCPGDFAFMIVSTYERGTASDLAGWVSANLNTTAQLESIDWGNAQEAARLPDGRRIALTPHHVVIMDLHSGLLDLETEMAARLGTWKFSF